MSSSVSSHEEEIEELAKALKAEVLGSTSSSSQLFFGAASTEELSVVSTVAATTTIATTTTSITETTTTTIISTKDTTAVSNTNLLGGDTVLLQHESPRLRKAPTPLHSAPSPTPEGTGHLHNMLESQSERLFQFWGMIFEYLCRPFDPAPSKKRREISVKMLQLTQMQAFERLDQTVTEEESTAFDANPLTDELFMQSATDDLDRILLRFLRARKWVVADAFNMFTDSLKWRQSFNIRRLLYEGERRIKLALLEAGKNYFWKTDLQGNLVCYIRARLHDKAAQTLEESAEFTVHSIELGRRVRINDEQLVTVVFDLRDAGLASLDISSMQFMVYCFQSFYPEIMSKCLVMNAPWIFWGFWRVVKPLLDPVVASKIEFIKTEDLPNYIELRNIPVEFGGTDPYAYRYIPPNVSDYPMTASENVASLLQLRLNVLRMRFIELSREYYSILTRFEDEQEREQMLSKVHEKRDQVKAELRECYSELDSYAIPRSFYHRAGIVGTDGSVDWSRYEALPVPDLRCSAPPAI